MFLHNFKYTLKTLFRKKSLIFWTFAFPLLMATFFNMAFANIIEDEQLKIIDIAIIENNEFNNNMLYKETFKTLSDKNNKDQLFNIKYITKEKADKLLEKGKIEGYLELNNNEPKLTFKSNGINQTIFKYVVDEIHDTEKLIATMMTSDLNKDVSNISNKISEYLNANEIKLENKASSNLDYMMIEYYTLIAMTCLYAGSIGMIAISATLPYLKGNGKRISVSASKKSSIIFSSLVASFIVQLMTLGLLFFYTICILKIDYGSNIPYIILLSLIGSLAGISLGVLLGTLLKSSESSKTGILIAIVMTGCFLAGMMGVGMKYVIDKNMPILNIINPANMITDGFYALYYYTNSSRYWFNIISLLIFSGLAIALSCRKLGRARYDSI